MKTIKQLALIIPFIAFAFAGAPSAQAAYVIDGLMNDWGVTPFGDWVPDSLTANFNEEDNRTHPYQRGIPRSEQQYTNPYYEGRDLEALYFDNDDTYIYWAMVSSVPFNSTSVSPRPEDLALDLDGNGTHEFALDVGLIDVQVGVGTPVTRDVYSVSSWYHAWGSDYAVRDYEVIGTYDLVNLGLGPIEPNQTGRLANTYVLEGRVARAIFGDAGNSEVWHMLFAKYECITDYIKLDGTIDDGPVDRPEIPEPATLALFGIGIAGHALTRFRKKK